MRKRWLKYAVIGFCFGIADWYFLDLLAAPSRNPSLNESLLQAPDFVRVLIVIALVASNYGIWLVPVIPTAIYEMKRSLSLRMAALAGVVVWSAAILSYYAYYTLMLMFVGLPGMEFMLFSNYSSASYWADWWPSFQRVILGQFGEWIGIALVGGALVGALSAIGYRDVAKRRVKVNVGELD